MSYPTILPRSSAVLAEVSEERARQDVKWGEQNHPNGTGDDRLLPAFSITYNGQATMGTLAYTARNWCQSLAESGTCTYAAILLEEVGEALAEEDSAALRAELIQVAAVAVAWVEKIDRDSRKQVAR
jgi:hypothetical protein